MIPIFITLYRVLVYFEIRLVTTTSENVASSGKDPVGANLYIHFPCLYCWRHRQLQRYNIRERETKERLSGTFCTKRNNCIYSLFYAMCKFSAHSPSMPKTVFQSSTFNRITCGRQWGSFTVYFEDRLRYCTELGT